MTNLKSQISLYNDLLIIEAFMQNKDKDHFIKNAFSFSHFAEEVKNYFSNQINPNDKVGSIINLLTPGAITIMFRALGLNKLGILLGIVSSAMGIDFAGITKSLYQTLVPKIKNNSIKESDVDSAVNSVISSQNTTLTSDQINEVEGLVKSSELTINDALILRKLADEVYKQISYGKHPKKIKIARIGKVKVKLLLFMGKVLKFIFKAALAALGLNVATNVGKKVIDKPSAFDSKTYPGAPAKTRESVPITTSNQTRFPLKTSYHNKIYNGANSSWIENYNNTTSGIKSMLVNFAKSVYGGLNGLEGVMTTVPNFIEMVDIIENYNINSAGNNFVIIPKQYKTKKQIVDHFIDEVAEKTPKISGTKPPAVIEPIKKMVV